MAAIPQSHRDLFDKKSFAHIATVGRDGTPQVTPVWIDYDGTDIRFNTARGRVKTRNLERNPSIALSVQDPDNPYRYVQVKGRVTGMTEEGADEHIATRRGAGDGEGHAREDPEHGVMQAR
jgi:PPOX class probable F420-dependent enzyme